MRAALRALLGLVVTSGVGLTCAPRGLPAIGPSLDPAGQATVLTTFALRAVAAGLCAYVALVLLALLLVGLRLLPASARRALDRWTGHGLAGSVRRLVGATALTIGVLPLNPLAAHAAEVAPPVIAPAEDPPPTIVPLGEAPPDVRPQAPPVITPTTRPPARFVRPPTAPPPTVVRPPADPPPVRAWHPSTERPAPAATTVVVRPGDSFWTIAEQLVELRNHRAPTDPEVIGPWLDLIERNREVLPDPADADLLRPGTVLELPPPR